jgi:hypothetical protein
MIAGIVLLGIVLYYMNKRAPAAVVPSEPTVELFDTLDVSRYRADTGVERTIDY